MTINLAPHALATSLVLRNATSLNNSTTITQSDDGSLSIVRNWPRFSSGEELLWSVLAWLNGATYCPSMPDLERGLDAENLAAAVFAMTAPVRVVEVVS